MDKWRLEKLESEINDVDCIDKIRPFIDKNADLVVKLLLEKLAEKDNEIERLKSALEYNENNIPNQRQQIRHQVCEEIKNALYMNFEYDNEYDLTLAESIIDQVEKGEKE